MPNENTLTRIENAIQLLCQQNKKITYSSIAEICNLSKQRVHQVMKRSGLTTGRTRENVDRFIARIQGIETESMSIYQIAYATEYTKAISTLRNILHVLNIPYRKHVRRKIDTKAALIGIHTTEMSLTEISKLIDYDKSNGSLKAILTYHKIPFKRVRRQCPALEPLRQMDTAPYTLKELHQLSGYENSEFSFRILLNKHAIPFKKTRQ